MHHFGFLFDLTIMAAEVRMIRLKSSQRHEGSAKIRFSPKRSGDKETKETKEKPESDKSSNEQKKPGALAPKNIWLLKTEKSRNGANRRFSNETVLV